MDQFFGSRDFHLSQTWASGTRGPFWAGAFEASLVMARPADIANAIIAELIHAGFELPAFSTLERITKHVRALAHRKVCHNVHRQLSAC